MPPKGVKLSSDAKTKISVGNSGKCSEKKLEHLRRVHQLNRGKCSQKKLEHLKKISANNRGKVRSPEHRMKLSKAQKNNPSTRDRLLRLSTAQKGRGFSLKHRERLTERRVGGFWYGNVRYYDGPQYCEKWTRELKERVRAYFGYICVECGTPQNGKKLDVHHVHYNKKLCCDTTPRTLVPLCASCHTKTLRDRVYWSAHFQEMIDMYYDGRCWMTREEFAAFKKS